MDRRQALRLLATGAALQLAPLNLFAALREARAVVGAQTSLRTLNPYQGGTVTAIAELILPKTDTPGAKDVGVSEFIDLILTEWYSGDDRTHFLRGLEDVDVRSQSLFGKNLIECTPKQQADILTALGEAMVEDADRLHDQPRQNRRSRREPAKNFYYMLRNLTLTAYYTSEAGATAELNYQIIPDRYDGCTDAPSPKEAPDRQ